MKQKKQLGIWLDHSSAYIIEFGNEEKDIQSLNSDFSAQDRAETAQRSENEMHNKEQQRHGTFYKNLMKIIRDYDEVLLFGPTEAKNKLHNLIKENHQYHEIAVEVKTTEKMTSKEQHDFVANYFTRFDFINKL
ncbi:MAG: hypothetical protein RLZZ312_170 [Bacteroidota bacterium]|jgi:stalled ribosome rescue protein Dom34